jgi:hypothetical protein
MAIVWYAYITHLGYRGEREERSMSRGAHCVIFVVKRTSNACLLMYDVFVSFAFPRQHAGIPLVSPCSGQCGGVDLSHTAHCGSAHQYDQDYHGVPLRLGVKS